MGQDQDDPYDWSTDQVVQYLCYNESCPWSTSKNPSPLPDRRFLENALRDHGITGEVLLDGELDDFLKNTLRLKHGPFYTVKKAIQYSRRQSTKYQAHQNQEHSHIAPSMLPMMMNMNSDRAWPNFFIAPWMLKNTTNGIVGDVLSQTVETVETVGNSTPKPASDRGKSPDQQLLSSLQDTQLSLSPRIAEIDQSDDSVPPLNEIQSRPIPNAQLDGPRTPKRRPNEATFIDERGRKRRKLDLTIGQTHNLSRPQQEHTEGKESDDWYIGPKRMVLANVFYPLSDSNGDDWSFSSTKHSWGERLFVKRKLHSFFRKPIIDLPRHNGARRFAMFPYDEDEANSSQPRYFTLYTSYKDRTEVTMKSTADTSEISSTALDHRARGNDRNPYDYLIKKYPPKEDSDSYPLYGDSGSEGDYDSDTLREMDDERKQDALKPQKNLSVHPVDSIIDQCIVQYEELWKARHLPNLELGAYKLWFNAHQKKCRNLQIKIALDNIECLKARLGKIRQALHKDEWLQESHLVNQCECLEPTIFELETQKHRVAILELRQCPPKPALVPRPISKTQEKPPQQPIDDESLNSDLDSSLKNFIEDDMSSLTRRANDGQLARGQPENDLPEPPHDTTMGSKSPLPIKTSDSAEPEVTPRDAVQDEGGLDDQSGSEAVQPRRLGLYYSSDSSNSDVEEPARFESHITPKKTEIIDLTSSPARSHASPLPESSLPSTKKSQGSASDGVMVVIHPPQKGIISSRTNPTPGQDPRLNRSRKAFDNKKEAISPQPNRPTSEEALKKVLAPLPAKVGMALYNHISNVSEAKFKRQIISGLNCIKRDRPAIPGVSAEQSEVVLQGTSFYIAWANRRILDKGGIYRNEIRRSLEQIYGQTEDFTRFFRLLRELLQKYGDGHSTSSSKDSDDDQYMDPLTTPHNKRKRQVKEDQAVKSGQVAARQRVENQERQRRNLEERLKRIGVSNSDAEHQAVSFEQPTIFLHPHIGRCVKPHQLAGIQFMWRELIQNEKRDGCLLAHTMGLGKTMQVISLLVTIAAAANSSDPGIRNQVPEFFHRSQTLILCPPSLIDNWYEEFLMWTPKDHALGVIRKVAPSDPLERRMSTIDSWDAEGGILILSYNLFRSWVAPELKKNAKSMPDLQFPSKLKDQLLKGPRIIVADEAHQMKNKSSQLARAAAMLESKSRIALTGSPLANNLLDYYAMINWISPKYLDELAVFKAKYLEPIEQGLFFDSTYQEQRRSLKKLQVLKQILTPKINRADISVLEGSLPSKTEFVITVPLTEVQKRAYDHYVSSLSNGKYGHLVSSTRFLAWLAVLGLCCNHPACFYDKLAKRAEESAPKPTTDDVIDPDTSLAEVPLSSLGFNEAMWASLKELLSDITDLDNPKYSYRASIFKIIVEESVRVGDKILCFSQSIPTLDYLERLLRASGIRFNRLDGSTAVNSRQEAVKNFNNREDVKVYLISTRAGGLGLNITGANRVIIFDFSFNPTWEEQAVGRAYRLGQKKPVYIYRFLAGGTYEEVVHNKSIFKTQLAMRVVDKKNVERSATKSLGEYLFPVKDVKEEDITEYIGRDRQVLDKILLDKETASSSILNIALTETFRRENNEMLTEDEKKEMEQELELELLRMSDPAAYEKKMLEASRRPEPTLVYPTTNLNTIHPSLDPPFASLGPQGPSTQIDKVAQSPSQNERTLSTPSNKSVPAQSQGTSATSSPTPRNFFKVPPWAGSGTTLPVSQSTIASGPRPEHLPPRPEFASPSRVNTNVSESPAQILMKSFPPKFQQKDSTQTTDSTQLPRASSSTLPVDEISGLPDGVSMESLAAQLGAD